MILISNSTQHVFTNTNVTFIIFGIYLGGVPHTEPPYPEPEPPTLEPNPEPECEQTKGNNMLSVVGGLLKITEMKDCDSSAAYYTKTFGVTIPEVCDTLIDKLLETLPGDEITKQMIRSQFPTFGVDPMSPVKSLCKCSCA